MLSYLERLASLPFGPHRYCYLNNPELIWLHTVSDVSIGLAYVAISITLTYLVLRIRNLPFHWMFLAFGLFIIACGATHFMEVWVIWQPRYWLQGLVKVVTALASVATAFMLPPLVPRVLALVRSAGLSEARRRQLESTNQELQTLYDKVRQLDEVKTQFFANVSHELRTPLALVLGPTEKLLASGGLDDGQRHDLEVVARNARTLLKHVNDLLDVARLEAGKMDVTYAETDLARLLRLTAAHFDALAQERHIAFAVETPAAVPAQVDAAKLERVFLNLLSNAFKFVPESGRVRCTLNAAQGHAIIAIADSGPGVRPELRQAIFERFRQGEGGAGRRFGGTGLGLAIARDFVELHGGTVSVGEAPEGGALFTVELPLTAPRGSAVQPAAEENLAAAEAARQALDELRSRAQAVDPAGRPERALVLVVEDHPEMRQFIAATLSAEYRTTTACDGREGLDKALSLRPDLILSDVMMPGHSGDDMLRALRARTELDTVPVVMLTAKADDELRVRLLREGAQDYLVKPFSAEELRVRVGNLVTMKRARDVLQQELETQLGDLEALAGEVTYRKRELQTALDAMRVAREHAEQASQVKSEFLSLVSHELRTPLTSINLYLQSLRRDRDHTLSPKQQDLVTRIAASSDRLLGLVESLLEYTRVQSGRLLLRPERIDVAALAADVVEELRPQAELKGLQLGFATIAEDLAPLRSDASMVRLVLVNLLQNAVKFTEQGRIEVSLGQEAGTARLTVTDTGPGIPAEQQAIIFEPFEHLEPLRQKHTPGVGLGLTLVREITRALGGWIELTSQVGVGSTFTAVLPSITESATAKEGLHAD